MRSRDYSIYMNFSPNELMTLSRKRGWVLSALGFVVYRLLRVAGFRPKNYKGICEYFEVGSSWGGISLGYFFVCEKGCKDYIKNHEVGHCVQNAAMGGLKMAAYGVASALRYLWRRIIPSSTSYYDWSFERDATDVGFAYVQRWQNTQE